MKVEDIIDVYGTSADYYDMVSGNTYKISEMAYDKQKNKTIIEVTRFGESIGFVSLEGDRTRK